MLRLEPNKFWVSPGDGDVLLWLQGLAINSGMDVDIHEPDVSPLQISGPKAGKLIQKLFNGIHDDLGCLLYTSPSPRDGLLSRMPSSA